MLMSRFAPVEFNYVLVSEHLQDSDFLDFLRFGAAPFDPFNSHGAATVWQ